MVGDEFDLFISPFGNNPTLDCNRGAAHFIMSHVFTKLDGSGRSEILYGISALISRFDRSKVAKVTHGKVPFDSLEELLENDRTIGRCSAQPGDSVRTLEQRKTLPMSVICEPVEDILFSDLAVLYVGTHTVSPVRSTLFAYLCYAGYLVGRPILESPGPAISEYSSSTVESNNEEFGVTKHDEKGASDPTMHKTATKNAKQNDRVRIANMQYYIPDRDVLTAWQRWMKDSVKNLGIA